MKLMELLEQGKKATREGIKVGYIHVVDNIVKTSNGFECGLGFDDLTRNDWYEYEEYKTNFDFKEGAKYYAITKSEVRERFNNTECILEEELKCFNAFKSKELAEFIYKKQLLERKLIVFSYLNYASEIAKYYIYCSYNNNEIFIETDGEASHFKISNIYFKNIETCKKAIELYEEEIKEVMEMKIKLGL